MPRMSKAVAAVLCCATMLLPGVTASAQPQPAADLPAKQLTGYWQNFVNGATPQRLSDVSGNYDLIALAFATTDPARPGAVTFGVDGALSDALGGYTDADLKADIAAKKSAGTSVVLSIGGAKGNVDLSSPQAVTNFVDSFTAIAKEYGIQGLDVDLEQSFDIANTASAIRQVAEAMGPDFLLTMAPQTLYVQPGGKYLELIKQVKDLVTVVHTQYYNSGSMTGCDGQVVEQGTVDFITGQACYLLEVLDAGQVALGFPASPSAAGSGYVSPEIVTAALDCLATGSSCGSYEPPQTYPAISGVMTWSTNWDASAGLAFSDPVRAHLDGMA